MPQKLKNNKQLINHLKPYPKYKDSGVEWLGMVPDGWKVLPNRTLFREVKNINHPDEEMLSVTISSGVILQSSLLSNSSKKDSSNEDKTKYKLVEIGDIAYNKMRAWQGAIGISKYRGIVSPAYIIHKRRRAINNDYYHSLFRTPYFAKEAERWSYGITSDQWSLRTEHFKMIYSLMPSQEEQTAIVFYLKYISSRINTYIAAKKKLVKLLEEQKQTIIHHAVTGAIDVRTGKPYLKYKETGDELVRVPWDWDSSKIKYVCSIHNGSDHKSIETDTGYPVIGSGGQFSYASRYIYDKESVLFGRKGTIDKPLYMDQPFWTVDTMFYTKIYKNIFPKYLYYIAKTIPYQFYSTQTALPSMTQTILGNLRIGLPSIESQKSIVDFIEQELYVIDQTIHHAKKEIDLLKEYRTRLTADVVTGKIDVREVAKNLPEEITTSLELVDDEVEESISDEQLEPTNEENKYSIS